MKKFGTVRTITREPFDSLFADGKTRMEAILSVLIYIDEDIWPASTNPSIFMWDNTDFYCAIKLANGSSDIEPDIEVIFAASFEEILLEMDEDEPYTIEDFEFDFCSNMDADEISEMWDKFN